MPDFEVGDHVKFAGGQGEINKIEDRPNGSHLLHVFTTKGQLRKLPNGLPHIERVDSIVDRFVASQVGSPVATKLVEGEYGNRLDLNDRLDGINLDRSGGAEGWVFRARNADWAHLMKDRWWRRTNHPIDDSRPPVGSQRHQDRLLPPPEG